MRVVCQAFGSFLFSLSNWDSLEGCANCGFFSYARCTVVEAAVKPQVGKVIQGMYRFFSPRLIPIQLILILSVNFLAPFLSAVAVSSHNRLFETLRRDGPRYPEQLYGDDGRPLPSRTAPRRRPAHFQTRASIVSHTNPPDN
jgi:hypothetical protein